MFQQPVEHGRTTAPPPSGRRYFSTKNATPPCGHFHKHWTTNVTFSVITRKTGLPPGSHFHEDWTINVTSRVLKRKTATTTCVLTRKNWHATWQPYIIRTNVLTTFHEDWTINLTFTVKTALPPGGHVFLPTGTIFELVKDFIGTHVLTKKTATSIFKLLQDINGTHVLTKFHEDWTINVISKVLTRLMLTLQQKAITKAHHEKVVLRKTATTTGGHVFHSTGTIFKLGLKIKTASPPGSHVFQPIGTIFELFHEDWTLNLTSTVKTAPPPGGHVFLPTGIIFELVKYFIGTHVPTKFHDDWTKNITSRVLNKENCHTPWHAGFSTTRSIFKLVQDINVTHVLTKFHEDWTINVTSKVLTRTHKRRSQKLTMSTLCSGGGGGGDGFMIPGKDPRSPEQLHVFSSSNFEVHATQHFWTDTSTDKFH
ncbi:hypothetical protein DPMN_109503 [Dreissena polymorpha]|uniref:Uncharacterized protein n=1 Tax=Dreissena polymorpha TaxID=45954 RepID=A0A9D4KAS8_DREPO|nr:hypothetical protein DPMN_109503 [Dreissena polymorpha]